MDNFNRTIFLLLFLFIFSLNIYGCSTINPPKKEIAQAEQIVDMAHKGRTPRYAPLELRLAQEKLTQAKIEMERRNYEQSRRLSEKARADAEFAIARAEAEYASEQMRQTRKGIQEMRTLTQ
jgi:hypothetical protein